MTEALQKKMQQEIEKYKALQKGMPFSTLQY